MFGDTLRQARKGRGLTQTQLAALAGLRQRDVAELETGRRTNPTVGTVTAIAAPLGLRLELRPVPPSPEATEKAA